MTDRSRTEEVSHPGFSAVYRAAGPACDRLFRADRAYLTAGLSGRVLDLGAGTGALGRYLAASERSDGTGAGTVEYHAVDPDPAMRRHAVAASAETPVSATVVGARGEELPYERNSFDAVIAALVFCTVGNPDAALDEVARVLRTGGEFRFLEHVGARGWRRRGQALLEPVWRRLAGGCHLTRESVARFVAHEAFAVDAVERTGHRTHPAAPVVRGRLERRACPRRGANGR